MNKKKPIIYAVVIAVTLGIVVFATPIYTKKCLLNLETGELEFYEGEVYNYSDDPQKTHKIFDAFVSRELAVSNHKRALCYEMSFSVAGKLDYCDTFGPGYFMVEAFDQRGKEYEKHMEELVRVYPAYAEVLNNKRLNRLVSSPDKQFVFRNEYNGLVVTESVLSDVKNALGEPLETRKMSNGRNYVYGDIVINISPPAAPAVNTIQILEQGKYTCPNGLQVGDSADEVLGIDHDLIDHFSGFSNDYQHGLTYWFEDGAVSKIVLGGIMVRGDPRGFIDPVPR